jgi:hypothetical protein
MLMKIPPFIHQTGRRFLTFLHRTGRWFLTALKDRDPHIASIALIISIGALIVSSWQYSAQIEHNKLSVKPHMAVTYILESGKRERNGIYVSNPGLGPAIIKTVSVE